LKIADISTPRKHELIFEKVENIPLQICETIYFRGILDASGLTENNQKLLSLIAQIIDQFGTKKHHFRDFDNLVSSKTAGLS
jgi:presequence protease